MPNGLKWGLIGGIASGLALTLWVVFDLFVRVPDFSGLKESIQVPIKLASGEKSVKLMGPKTANWTPLSAISEWLPRAVVASEDASFYSHKGIDVFEMQEALKKDIKEGRLARGASTITQQVLKNVYLSDHWKIWRKIKEIAWASKLEAALNKPQILAFYLNMAEWGPGIYGVGEASRYYFSTSPSNLTPRQSAFLAMMLPSPRRYHSFFKKKQLTEWAWKRVNRILTVMSKLGQLPEDQFDLAMNEKLWGSDVIPDSDPNAPKDPGWDADESDYENFEPVAGKLPVVPKSPVVPEAETDVTVAPSEPVSADNPLVESPALEPLPDQKTLNSTPAPEPPPAAEPGPASLSEPQVEEDTPVPVTE